MQLLKKILISSVLLLWFVVTCSGVVGNLASKVLTASNSSVEHKSCGHFIPPKLW